MNNRCWEEFLNSNGLFFNTAVVLEEKLERDLLLEKYIQQTLRKKKITKKIILD